MYNDVEEPDVLTHIDGGVVTEVHYDIPTMSYIVQSRTKSGLDLKNVFTAQMYAYTGTELTGKQWALSMHKSTAGYKEMKPKLVKLSQGDELTATVNISISEDTDVDLSFLQIVLKEAVAKAVSQSESVEVEHSKKSSPKKKADLNEKVSEQHKYNIYQMKTFNEVKAYKEVSSTKGLPGHPVVHNLNKIFNGLGQTVLHPVGNYKISLANCVVSLNDSHGWSREKIADWIETLDIDTTVKVVEGE